MAKKKVVTKEQLKKSGFTNLRDYMNAFKFDDDKGKYVERKKALVRKKNKPVDDGPDLSKKIIKDSRSDRLNINPFAKSTAAKRADADNISPFAKSTASDSPKVKGANNLVTEREKKRGSVFQSGLKKGGVVSKGGSVRKAAKKKSIDGIAKKGKTKGRII